MSDDYKQRVKAAIEKFHAKELNEFSRLSTSRKNAKPEKEVETDCLKWMKALSWDVGIYESKNTRDQYGSYLASRMPPGVCDIMGIAPNGIPIYVELKAKGKRSTFNRDDNIRQVEFLVSKINYFGFGAVIDSVSLLKSTWKEFLRLKSGWGEIASRDFLLDALPKRKDAPTDESDENLFDD